MSREGYARIGEDNSLAAERDDGNWDGNIPKRMARWKVYSIQIAAAVVFLTGIILFSVSWDVVEPTEYGFLYNGVSGHIDTSKVYDGGRYCVGPNHYFVKYPRMQSTMEFSARKGADFAPVVSRTQDGATITLSFAFQFRFNKSVLQQVWTRFNNNYKQPMSRIARTSILEAASNYSSQAYWQQRTVISDAMQDSLTDILEGSVMCVVEDFQMLRIDLPASYEASIIAKQVQEQQVMQQEKEQQVAAYMSQIQTILAQANQTISNINAQANAQSIANLNTAHISAFNYTQNVQAAAYARLAQALNFNGTQFTRYLKIRSIKKKTQGAISVGLNP